MNYTLYWMNHQFLKQAHSVGIRLLMIRPTDSTNMWAEYWALI